MDDAPLVVEGGDEFPAANSELSDAKMDPKAAGQIRTCIDHLRHAKTSRAPLRKDQRVQEVSSS